MKPGQKLCVICMKSYQENLNFAESSDDDKNDGHTTDMVSLAFKSPHFLLICPRSILEK